MEIFKDLFNTIVDFRKMAPWKWMENGDIFIVENPKTKQKGYCCVMGAGGETFGLAVYLDQSGWRWLNDRIMDIAVDPFTQYAQNCISVTFENLKELEPTDKKLIKDLGFQFRGKFAYPLLRRNSPGSMPRMLTSEEAEFLDLALKQVMLIAPMAKKNPEYLLPDNGDLLLRREEIKENRKEWVDLWVNPDDISDPLVTDISFLSQNIKLFNKISPSNSQTWIADMYFFPEPVIEKKGTEPFFPLVMVIIDKRDGVILSFRLIEYKNYQAEIINLFLEAVKKANLIPGHVQTIRPEIYLALSSLQGTLGIELFLSDYLKEVDEMQQEIILSFMNRNGSIN